MQVLLAEDKDLIDLKKATCSSAEDKERIEHAVAGKEQEIVALVARLIRDVVCLDARRTPLNEAMWPLRDESVDLRGVDMPQTRLGARTTDASTQHPC